MTFKDWHLTMYGVYPGSGIKVDGFEARKAGWNAALEESAKIAESRASTPGSVLEAPIRSLKEE